MQKITPCLWFDSNAEEAAQFYTSIFKNSKIRHISRYTEAGYEIHRRPAGTAMTVEFELDGQTITAMNGGPGLKFKKAVSYEVSCRSPEEMGSFWAKLSAGAQN